MITYGSQRHDLDRCPYGCCGGKLLKFRGKPGCAAARRAAKKRARQQPIALD